MGLHENITGANIHVAHRWEVADKAARLALTATSGDFGKVAFQSDDKTAWLLVDASPMKWKQITNAAFGSEFSIAADISLSYTTSSIWQQKLRLMLTDVPAGDYVLLWGCDLINGASGKPSLRVQSDDTLDLFVQEDFSLSENLKWYPFAGHAAVTGWAGGSHFIDIDYHSNNPNQVGIQNARLTVWRAV